MAEQFGTPLYAFDAETIRTCVRELTEFIGHSPTKLLFSVKAHGSVGLLELLRAMGVGADASSSGDLAFAAGAGLEGDEISFTSVSLSEDDLRCADKLGALIVADSIQQIERVASAAGRRDVGIRVRCGITAGFDPLVQADAPGSKFGISISELPDAVAKAQSLGLRVVGLHGHLGSDLMSAEPHLLLLDVLLELTRAWLRDATMVDIGGGWGTPFPPADAGIAYPPRANSVRYPLSAFGRGVTERMRRFEAQTGRRLELRLEPGAFLLMESGVLVCRVTDTKPAGARDEGSVAMAVVDSSYNHLHSAVVHKTFHPLFADVPPGRDLVAQDVVGNLMQAGDVLAPHRTLPRLCVGDVVGFGMAGAYKACRAPVFNGRPRPAEVLVDGGQATLLRRRESIADLLAYEVASRFSAGQP